MAVVMSSLTPALIMLFSFYSVTILLITMGTWQSNKARRAALPNQDTLVQIVREVTGVLPAPHAASPSPKQPLFRQLIYLILLCALFTLIYLVLYSLVGVVMRLIWPNLTEAIKQLADIVVSLLIPLGLGWLILPLVARWMILAPSQRRFTDRENCLLSGLRYIQWVAIVGASIAMLIVLDVAYGWGLTFLAFLAYYFVSIVLWRFFSKPALYFPQYWVHSALANADYDEALRRIQVIETKFPQDGVASCNRGTILLFAGQYAEAERFLLQSLQEALKLNTCLPVALTNLGYTYLRQGRYEDATRVLQGTTKLNPKGGHAYAGLAEVYLYQGIEPQVALDLIVRFLKSTSRSQMRDRTAWGAIVGDEAWALALLGRHADAQQALRDAFELTDKSFRPGLAGLRFREGKVHQIQGNRLRAIQSFQRAIQLDPIGAYGQLSQEVLEGLHSEAK